MYCTASETSRCDLVFTYFAAAICRTKLNQFDFVRQIPAKKIFAITMSHEATCAAICRLVCRLVCRFVVSCVSCVEWSFLRRWKFKRQNPTLNISPFGYEKKQLSPIYISDQQWEEHVNLLLISNNETMHYWLIRNLCRLLASLTKYKGKKFFCDYCLCIDL